MSNNTAADEEKDTFLSRGNEQPNVGSGNGRFGKRVMEEEPRPSTINRRTAVVTLILSITFIVAGYLFLNVIKNTKSEGQTPTPDTSVHASEEVWGSEETKSTTDTDSLSPAEDSIQSNSSEGVSILESGDDFNSSLSLAQDSVQGNSSDNEFNTTKNEWTSWLHTLPGLMHRANECEVALGKYKEGTYLHEMMRADCGRGYTLPEPNRTAKPWRVGLLGRFAVEHAKIRALSGCEYGHSCPSNPTCEIILVPRESALAHRMDVVVAVATEPHIVHALPRTQHQIRVLYWREALWDNTPSVQVQLHEFDLEMGVHYSAAINNPNFALQPSFLLQGIIKPIPKSGFAASVISDCATPSHRHTYLAHLAAVLGPNRVHQYGKCGTRSFPSRPLQHGFTILSRYKFFFAFENSIQKGYTTEKLFETLLLPVVPVYYGDPGATNITTTPSYIKASDFRNPVALAHYLLQLDRNPEEYERYHEWRKHPEPFQMEYLRKVSKIPGPREVLAANEGKNNLWGIRKAMCCRLCNEPFLREQMAARTHADVVTARFREPEIAHRFYGGAAVHFDP